MKRLYEEKHGRAVLLQDKMDARVQAYIRKVHEGGRTISALVVIAAACGILLSCEKCALKNDIAVLLNLVYCQALFQVHTLWFSQDTMFHSSCHIVMRSKSDAS